MQHDKQGKTGLSERVSPGKEQLAGAAKNNLSIPLCCHSRHPVPDQKTDARWSDPLK